MNTNLKIPRDPYKLSEKIQRLGSQNKVKEAIGLMMATPVRFQSVISWNCLIEECSRKDVLSMTMKLFNAVYFDFIIIHP